MEPVLFILIYFILAARYLCYFHKKLVEYNQKRWAEVRNAYIWLVYKSAMIVFPLIFIAAVISKLLAMYIKFMMNYIT